MDLNNLWFQQDGATCHTLRNTVNLLKEKFEGFIISQNGDINYTPRSPDLTSLDYSLWSYVKSLVYADKLRRVTHFKNNITGIIREIEPRLCEKVTENWVTRTHTTERSCDSHLNDIVFHTIIPLNVLSHKIKICTIFHIHFVLFQFKDLPRLLENPVYLILTTVARFTPVYTFHKLVDSLFLKVTFLES